VRETLAEPEAVLEAEAEPVADGLAEGVGKRTQAASAVSVHACT